MASVKLAGVEQCGMLAIIHLACAREHSEFWEQVAYELNVSTANLGPERAWDQNRTANGNSKFALHPRGP